MVGISKQWSFVWICMVSFVVGASNGFSPTAIGQIAPQWEWTAPISLPPMSDEELIAVRFNDSVYATAMLEYSDVRLFDAAGKEVTFVIRRARDKRSVTEQRTWFPKHVSLNILENNELQITFQVDTEKYPQWPAAIRLVSPLERFEHNVRVKSSANGQDWEFLAEQSIFDYSQFMSVRDTEIRLPQRDTTSENDAPAWYQLTISDVTQEQQSQLLELTRNLEQGNETQRQVRTVIDRRPFRIDRIELWNEESRRDVPTDLQVDYELKIERVETDSETKETFVYLESGRQPLVAVKVETSHRNFSRRARLEVLNETSEFGRAGLNRDTAQPWHSISSGKLTNIDFRSLKEEQLTLTFGESRLNHYRLVIENGDSAPLAVTNVVGVGPAYGAVFLANASAKYHLVYGNSILAAPDYDTTVLFVAMSEGILPKVATLETATKSNVISVPEEAFLVRALRSPVFVTLVILALVSALGFGLLRASRRLEKL